MACAKPPNDTTPAQRVTSPTATTSATAIASRVVDNADHRITRFARSKSDVDRAVTDAKRAVEAARNARKPDPASIRKLETKLRKIEGKAQKRKGELDRADNPPGARNFEEGVRNSQFKARILELAPATQNFTSIQYRERDNRDGSKTVDWWESAYGRLDGPPGERWEFVAVDDTKLPADGAFATSLRASHDKPYSHRRLHFSPDGRFVAYEVLRPGWAPPKVEIPTSE